MNQWRFEMVNEPNTDAVNIFTKLTRSFEKNITLVLYVFFFEKVDHQPLKTSQHP